jgi:hypothetical protein
MFVRLTRRVRAKAGWLVALLYLLCVLAPGVALALGDAASCLMTEFPTTAAAHIHDDAQPLHAVSHRHVEEHQHHADAGGATHDHARHQHGGETSHGGKTSPEPCCAMMCISAIAANPPAVATPVQPISFCVSEIFQRLPGEAPPLLYRPPIG